jgi:antitoxin component YwqK of YwqJK toxin-antitoxin module
MLFLIYFIILMSFNNTPAYTSEIQTFSTHSAPEAVAHKILNSKDLVYKDSLGYKRFASTPFTGKIIGREEGFLNKGKWHGPYISYYKTGQLKHKGSYKMAKKDGPWKSFRIDKNIISEGSYKNGLNEGIWKYYHLFGTNLQMVTNFRNGKKDGEFKSFYGNGNLMQKGNYINGNPDGLWIFYEKDGRKEKYRKIH